LSGIWARYEVIFIRQWLPLADAIEPLRAGHAAVHQELQRPIAVERRLRGPVGRRQRGFVFQGVVPASGGLENPAQMRVLGWGSTRILRP
jgi:hypothetical protein